MRLFKGLVLGVLLTSLMHIYIFGWSTWSDSVVVKWFQIRSEHFTETSSPLTEIPKMQIPDQTAQEYSRAEINATNDLKKEDLEVQSGLYIGMPKSEVVELLGDPTRQDPSAYGYTWWIYNQDWQTYIQLGIKDNKVVTIYTNGPQWGWGTFAPGSTAEEWQKNGDEQASISFHYKLGFFTFELSEADQKERPLILDGNTAIQLYIDIHDHNKVSGIRLMDIETLLLHRPYALKYVGQLPEPAGLSTEQWEAVERANEKQIYDVVNVTRQAYQLDSFTWHDELADVARGHSLDMLENEYFDHLSPTNGDLGNRLRKANVTYRSAGENIAWNYVDGPDAHQGWLNSLGHRKNIMQEQFSHLGVGVIQKHYTQNFLLP